jgi:Xaa-Pro aminopeptidase
MRNRGVVAGLLLTALSGPLAAQPVFSNIFPPEEYAARRARVMEQIGDGVAIMLGTTERPGEQPMRQANQFHYLVDVVDPRAMLVMDGRTKRTTLYLHPEGERREGSEGPVLHPGDSAARVTGVDAVVKVDEFAVTVAEIARENRTIYTGLRPEVLGMASAVDPANLWKNNRNDPWDGRDSREEAFIRHLKAAAPGSVMRDLDPVIDKLRVIKSPGEQQIMREGSRVAGLGIIEAMRDAKVGMYEYELQAPAEYVFKKYGSYGGAYFAIIATGTNTEHSHYNRDTDKLEDGDLVLFDYAPDYKYYAHDVTRMFPASGKFNKWNREYYTIYLRMYQALMTSIKPHAEPRAIMLEAGAKMGKIIAAYPFTDPRIKEAATRFAAQYQNAPAYAGSLGHGVGLEVHDVRRTSGPLQPGEVFTIEPAMTIPEMHLSCRIEDMILVTQTGYENMSAFVPVEPADIEKLMAQRGLSTYAYKLPATVPPRSVW